MIRTVRITSNVPNLMTWTQNAAIFTVCVNLFSTAFANIGLFIFLFLFAFLCVLSWTSKQEWQLDTKNFPWSIALGIAAYLGWQVVGLTYTDAPMDYALKNVFADRKLLYILPLTLIFSASEPKRRFLKVFLATTACWLLVSFVFALVLRYNLLPCNPAKSNWPRCNAGVLLRSEAMQSMVFAMSACLAFWFSLQQKVQSKKWALLVLAGAFALNVVLLTPGRSGYVAFIVFVVFGFAWWRGVKGLLWGSVAAVLASALVFHFSPSVHKRVMQGINEARYVALSPKETSLGRRITMYENTVEMIAENPVLGLGTGAFKQHFSAIAKAKYTGWRAEPFDDPHSQYLFITVENGLVGLVIFLALITVMIRRCLAGDDYAKLAAGCLFAWCATSLTTGHFRAFPEGHLIAFLVGILMVGKDSRC